MTGPDQDGNGRATRPRETPRNLSVERAARMLGLFSLDRPELSLGEMTEALGTSRATTHRFAMALRRTGLLRYNAETQRYTVGPRIIELASVAIASLPVLDIATPHMERLSVRFGETIVLSTWDGDAPLILRVVDRTNRVVTINVRSGGRIGRYESAHGPLFLALDEYLDVDESKLSPEIVRRIRETHVSVYTSEKHGYRAIATPIFQDGKITAGLGVVGLTSTMSADDTSSLTLELKRTAAVISAELKMESPYDEPDR